MQVARWGRNYAIKLPAKLFKELDLKVGDELELKKTVLQKGHITELHVEKVPSKIEMLADVRDLRTVITYNSTFDRDEANAR